MDDLRGEWWPVLRLGEASSREQDHWTEAIRYPRFISGSRLLPYKEGESIPKWVPVSDRRYPQWVPVSVRQYVKNLTNVDLPKEEQACLARLLTGEGMRIVYRWLARLPEPMAVHWIVSSLMSYGNWDRYRKDLKLAGAILKDISDLSNQLAVKLRDLERCSVDGVHEVLLLDDLVSQWMVRREDVDIYPPWVLTSTCMAEMARLADKLRPYHSSERLALAMRSQKACQKAEFIRVFYATLKARSFPLDTRGLYPRIADTATIVLDEPDGIAVDYVRRILTK